MASPEVALTLTSGQLWGALIVIGGAFVGLVAYIYIQETSRTNARIEGLHNKLEKEVEELRKDFSDKLTAQNQQLERTLTQLQDATNSMTKVITDFDKRLLRHEVRMGG